MRSMSQAGFLLSLGLVLGVASPARAQAPPQRLAVPNVVQILGLENVKENAKGTLTVEGSTLDFTAGRQKADVAIPSLLDVFTGEDSARAVGGTVGTVSMFAPYGGGRFLSLFRKKTDMLTVEYRDDKGGLHGVVFTLPAGQSVVVKKQLVTLGAHASIPVEEEVQAREKQKEKKDKKEKEKKQ
jgi:hypothetical protein